MTQPLYSSHSADVQMWLDCGEHGRLALTRVTPKSVVAEAPRDIPPCRAELIVAVDGRFLRNTVNLASGFSRGRSVALVLPVDDVAPF
jgi:hypothetical protein